VRNQKALVLNEDEAVLWDREREVGLFWDEEDEKSEE
jgi:hypothetical protein